MRLQEDYTLQLVMNVPCHPSRHSDLRVDPLAVLDPVEVGSVAGTMASTWSATASLLADLCGAGWDASGDALSSGHYVEIRAVAPAGASYDEALRVAQQVGADAEQHGIQVTLWRSDDPARMGEPVGAAA